MKVKFYTLGCKVNQYESQAIGESLKKRGFEITDGKEAADVVIVNSCTVTAESDRKPRQAVRRFKRQNPHGIVVLTGCMPQAYPDKAKELLELSSRTVTQIAQQTGFNNVTYFNRLFKKRFGKSPSEFRK